MNDSERTELARLNEQQARLEAEVAGLRQSLLRFEERFKSPLRESSPAAAAGPVAKSLGASAALAVAPPAAEMPVPPIIPTPCAVAQPVEHRLNRFDSRIASKALGPGIGTGNRAEGETPTPLRSAETQRAATVEDSSLELRLGTYWLVRIGIVMVLTALAFFGNYAYQNFIGHLGPAGKVGLLYLASGLLFGAGAWWQRQSVKESLRTYAQVLFAGGLAAVYFTTYAAHHFEPLRVIASPVLDGALLLAWAGFMVWIADRRKSEVLALFAVGLAYYTAVITGPGPSLSSRTWSSPRPQWSCWCATAGRRSPSPAWPPLTRPMVFGDSSMTAPGNGRARARI